jgi:hypothetical protein
LKNIASIVSTNIVHVNEWKARVKRSTITSKVKVGSLRVKACFKLGDQGCQCLSALLICHFAYPGSTGTLVAVGTEDAIFWVAVLEGWWSVRVVVSYQFGKGSRLGRRPTSHGF